MRERLLVLFGSETGNAEEVSYTLHSELSKAKYSCQVMSFEDYDVMTLPDESHVIFVVSTTGDGDLPLTMKKFWNFLMRKTLPSTCLTTVNFSVFGLGDSSYEKFNFVARKLQARLKQLGGREFLSMGLGDDQATYSYFSAYNSWCKQLYTYLETRYALTTSSEEASILPSTVDAYSILSETPQITTSVSVEEDSHQMNRIFTTTVVDNIRMTHPTWNQDVRHLKFLVSSADISPEGCDTSSPPLYLPGDIAEVFYHNSSDLVNRAIALLVTNNVHNKHLLANDVVCIQRNTVVFGNRHSRVSNLTCSIVELFREKLDIGAVPKRSFFTTMSQYATNIDERDKLSELGSALGTDLYFDYCIKEKRNYLDVLQEFRSVQPTLSALIACIPLIAPRQYSIASSALVNNNQIDLCVAIVKYQTPYRRNK
jgi:sulfite reductase alpha subunit-like flavoprotein